MNILQIEDTIRELKSLPNTFKNVQNLAAYIIVHDHIQKANLVPSRASGTVSNDGMSDILPAYKSYIDEKLKYQSGNMIIDTLNKTLVLLTKEIEDFILTLYADSESKQSRRTIEKMVERLYTKLCS